MPSMLFEETPDELAPGSSVSTLSEKRTKTGTAPTLGGAPEKASEAAAPYAPPTPPQRTVVLIVEDQADIRDLLNCVLSEEGFEVLSAENGTAALKLLNENKGRIKVIVTDVLMPGMNGSELAEQAEQIDGTLKILFISGFTGQVLIQKKLPSPGRKFLAKPFSPYDLVGHIRELMGQAKN